MMNDRQLNIAKCQSSVIEPVGIRVMAIAHKIKPRAEQAGNTILNVSITPPCTGHSNLIKARNQKELTGPIAATAVRVSRVVTAQTVNRMSFSEPVLFLFNTATALKIEVNWWMHRFNTPDLQAGWNGVLVRATGNQQTHRRASRFASTLYWMLGIAFAPPSLPIKLIEMMYQEPDRE